MTETRKLRAAIYTRISKLSATNDDSTQRQEARCRDYCRAQGWSIAATFKDEGVSGYRDVKRPGWIALEQDVAAGKVDVVVVFAISRAGRSVLQLVRFVELCKEAGVRFVSVTEGIDTGSSAMGHLIFTIFSALAELESQTKSERLLSKNAAKAAAGEFHGGQVPYGYARVDGKTVVDRDESRVLREAAQRVINGESLRSIEKDLNRRGIPAKKGGPWSGQLRNCLAQPFIVGRRMHNGQDVAAAQWPAIIDPATWHKVQEIFATNSRRRATHGAPRTYVLTGILECGECGSRLAGGNARYICRKCHRLGIRARDVEDEVLFQASYQKPPATHVVKDPDELTAEFLLARNLLEVRKKQAEAAYADGELSIEMLTGVSARIDRELGELDARYGAEAEHAVPSLPNDPRAMLEMLVESIVVAPARPGQNRAPVAERLTIVWRDGVTTTEEPPERRPAAPKRARPPCSVDGCERPSQVLGVRKVKGQRGITDRPLCAMHYSRMQNHGEVGPAVPYIKLGPKSQDACSVPSCTYPVVARGLCRGHYSRQLRTGDPQPGIPLKGSPVTKQDRRPRKSRAA